MGAIHAGHPCPIAKESPLNHHDWPPSLCGFRWSISFVPYAGCLLRAVRLLVSFSIPLPLSLGGYSNFNLLILDFNGENLLLSSLRILQDLKCNSILRIAKDSIREAPAGSGQPRAPTVNLATRSNSHTG